jgi:phospholipase/lecithinase/hemolysin
MKRLFLLAWVLVTLGFGLGLSIARADFTSIVAFGDSTTDTGNVFAATGQPVAPYYQGRFSNGQIWVDYLAQSLGVPLPTPSSVGGTNYAWGGAWTGTGVSHVNTPNLLTQVGTFVGGGGTLNSNHLVAIWAGGNDFLFQMQTNPQISVDNIGLAITTLAGVGGRHFVVPNIPVLGELPLLPTVTALERQLLNAVSIDFNARLALKLSQLEAALGIRIDSPDIAAGYQQIRANPAAFGFTNVTDGALLVTPPNVSGQGFMFWDEVHATTATHQLIGAAAYQLVPEPSSLVLVIMAVAVLGGAAGARAVRRRRR